MRKKNQFTIIFFFLGLRCEVYPRDFLNWLPSSAGFVVRQFSLGNPKKKKIPRQESQGIQAFYFPEM